MRKSYVTVYDLEMRKVAYLENAMNVGFETPLNAIWRATFELPLNDEKNELCKPFYFVELFDGDERVELFRILPQTAQRNSTFNVAKYQCEHVLATLLDDVLFQYHQIGNLGVYTHQVLNYILDKQVSKRWKLGEVQFTHQFEYSWENTNLLAALFSVAQPFVDSYQWTWDTSSFPWTLNLVRPSDDVQAYIRYGRNMTGIEKIEDPTNLANRIYALGYGEGVNQLTFESINEGKAYVEDIESQRRYGLKQTVWVDRRFQYEETLLARAEALLEELKEPRTTYIVQAAELYRLTKDPIDRFRTGTIVRIQDDEIGIDVFARVVNVSKKNLIGAPGDVEIEIANRPLDIAGSIAELQNRQRINELYAQGATNYDSHDFADNCDPQHPAVLKFWIPEETARINKVMLSYQSEAFRAYSRAIESAPATTSGPSSRETTVVDPAKTSGPSSRQTTVPDGRSDLTTSRTDGQSWLISGDYSTRDIMSLDGDHNHGIDDGTKLMTADGGFVTFVQSGRHAHGIVPHDHRYSTLDHTHGMDHTHTIPAHSHGMDHTHVIPPHTHDIEHGIFRGPSPSAVTVKVDGKIVPGLGTNETEVDIIPYLAKEGTGGRIARGWHTIEILPNNLGRIVANVFIQLFAQSRGGGDY